jgi:hypothetical protein
VHAQPLGRLELIPLVFLQHRKNEDFLELAQPFRVSNAILVHLQSEILELNLHGSDLFVRSSTLPRTRKSFFVSLALWKSHRPPAEGIEKSREAALTQEEFSAPKTGIDSNSMGS